MLNHLKKEEEEEEEADSLFFTIVLYFNNNNNKIFQNKINLKPILVTIYLLVKRFTCSKFIEKK